MTVEGMRLLSVDDIRNNLMIIEAYARRLNLTVSSFTNPDEALASVEDTTYDIVIVDYMMPDMNGLQFIRAFREKDQTAPIIMITAAGDDQTLQREALEAGATDFLSKPMNGGIFQARVTNLLRLKKALNMTSDQAALLKDEVEKATQEIKRSEQETLEVLGKVSEYKDPETSEHVLRVGHYSRLIAEAYGLDQRTQDIILKAAPFHDMGKVGIPDKVLLKPGKLDGDEWTLMMTHAQIGYNLLHGATSTFLQAGSIIAISHHEKYDGTGYPRGLAGSMIPLYGRIVAIADVFDALCSKRPYKESWSFEKAFDLIVSEKGRHFDPQCVDCFIKQKNEVRRIYDTYKEVTNV